MIEALLPERAESHPETVRTPARLEFVAEGCGTRYGTHCARISGGHCYVVIADSPHVHVVVDDEYQAIREPFGVCSEGCAIALLEEEGLEVRRD